MFQQADTDPSWSMTLPTQFEVVAFIDFADPLSYVISTQVEGWGKAARRPVRWVPTVSSSSEDSEEDRARRLVMSTALADAWGYPLFARYGIDSLPALRAALLADEQGTLAQYVMRVFQFWYATDLPPYADVLFEGLVTDCRLDPTDLHGALSDDAHRTSVGLERMADFARHLGVESTPVIVSGDITIDLRTLDPKAPLDDLTARLVDAGLSAVSTEPSRCYLPRRADQVERFCRWCSCQRGPA